MISSTTLARPSRATSRLSQRSITDYVHRVKIDPKKSTEITGGSVDAGSAAKDGGIVAKEQSQEYDSLLSQAASRYIQGEFSVVDHTQSCDPDGPETSIYEGATDTMLPTTTKIQDEDSLIPGFESCPVRFVSSPLRQSRPIRRAWDRSQSDLGLLGSFSDASGGYQSDTEECFDTKMIDGMHSQVISSPQKSARSRSNREKRSVTFSLALDETPAKTEKNVPPHKADRFAVAAGNVKRNTKSKPGRSKKISAVKNVGLAEDVVREKGVIHRLPEKMLLRAEGHDQNSNINPKVSDTSTIDQSDTLELRELDNSGSQLEHEHAILEQCHAPPRENRGLGSNDGESFKCPILPRASGQVAVKKAKTCKRRPRMFEQSDTLLQFERFSNLKLTEKGKNAILNQSDRFATMIAQEMRLRLKSQHRTRLCFADVKEIMKSFGLIPEENLNIQLYKICQDVLSFPDLHKVIPLAQLGGNNSPEDLWNKIPEERQARGTK